MSRSTNREIECYWARKLAQSEILVKILQAKKVRLIDRDSHDDPPDALFEAHYDNGDSRKLWCEMIGAWRSQEDAETTFQNVEGKRQIPPKSNGVMLNPDRQTARSVRKAIKKKLQKKTYKNLVSKYGIGHLHVYVARDHYPLVDCDTVMRILDKLPIQRLECQSTFRSVSLGWNDRIWCLWDTKHGVAR